MVADTRTSPPTRADLRAVKLTLVYWCERGEWYRPLSDGPWCMEEDPHAMRKRRMYICTYCEQRKYDTSAWFDRAEFLAHHEEE